VGWKPLRLAAGALCLGVSACQTIRFDVSHAPTATQPIEVRKNFFWWSLYPDMEVDMRTYCPDGTGRIEEQTTFTDGLLGSLTLGIYTPRTSYYYCRLPAPPPTVAAPVPPAPGASP